MNYNQFTIDYISALQRNLNISINSEGDAIFNIDSITTNNLIDLKSDIDNIWSDAESAIKIVQDKQNAIVQSALFGLVNDLNTALKVGFLLGDRVVLIDYLYERILSKKSPQNIDINHLGVLASSLVSALPLAVEGRIVIIPSPFSWFPETKTIMREVASKTTMTMELMSLLNTLSITKNCQLHPYTIAESEEEYLSIVNERLNHIDVIGKSFDNYSYKGILGALLSEKLIYSEEFEFIVDLPLSKYHHVISENKEFYNKYLEVITSGGIIDSENILSKIIQEVKDESIQKRNQIPQGLAKGITAFGGVSGGVISLLSAISVLSTPIAVTGAILSLSSTLFGLLKSKAKNEDPLINVFGKLHELK